METTVSTVMDRLNFLGEVKLSKNPALPDSAYSVEKNAYFAYLLKEYFNWNMSQLEMYAECSAYSVEERSEVCYYIKQFALDYAKEHTDRVLGYYAACLKDLAKENYNNNPENFYQD